LTYAIERLQGYALPGWESAASRRRGPDLAWNTAASFTTNTNWQFYTPESTMSYLTQMAGLATHNFWSAARASWWPWRSFAASSARTSAPSATSGSI
jgi:potassium-transporting ATPase potassium-binding subunit